MTDAVALEIATRTYTYTRPGQPDLSALAALDGLGQLRSMARGEVPHPPVMDTLGMTGFHPERGKVVAEMPAQDFHYNPLGTVHGGVISTVLDTVTGCAVQSVLEVGELYTTLDLTVKFLRPVTVDSGLLRAEGIVIQRGRRTALAEAKLYDEAGRLAAHAVSSCMIFS